MRLVTLTSNNTSRTSTTSTPGETDTLPFMPRSRLHLVPTLFPTVRKLTNPVRLQNHGLGCQADGVQPGLRQAHVSVQADQEHLFLLPGELHRHGEGEPAEPQFFDPAALLRLQEPPETPPGLWQVS